LADFSSAPTVFGIGRSSPAGGWLRSGRDSVKVALAMGTASPRVLSSFLACLALSGASLLAACGHPASEAECQTIVERIVELELKAQKITDPAEIAKRRAESIGVSGDGGKSEVLQGCIGRHITDRALECVKGAESASEITERCLR
jgi:hypothetical protein